MEQVWKQVQNFQIQRLTGDLMPRLFISIPRTLPSEKSFKAVAISTSSHQSLGRTEGNTQLKNDDLEQLRRRRKTEWKRKQGVSRQSYNPARFLKCLI